MVLQRQRATRVVRSRATIQTAVDDAVVKTLAPLDERHETRAHFHVTQKRVAMLVREMENERKGVLMTNCVFSIASPC